MSKHYGKAITVCSNAINSGRYSGSNLATVLTRRGIAYSHKDRYDLAMADYTKAIKLDPSNYRVFYERGLVHSHYKQYGLAIADFTKAIKLNPSCYCEYYNRGLAYDHSGQYTFAIADCEKAIAINSSNLDGYYCLGNAHDDNGDYKLAIADYSKEIKLEPSSSSAFYDRGLAYNDNGQAGLAIADFTQAIKLDSSNGDAYDQLGRTYENRWVSGLAYIDFSKAVRLYGKYLKLHPSASDAGSIRREMERVVKRKHREVIFGLLFPLIYFGAGLALIFGVSFEKRLSARAKKPLLLESFCLLTFGAFHFIDMGRAGFMLRDFLVPFLAGILITLFLTGDLRSKGRHKESGE